MRMEKTQVSQYIYELSYGIFKRCCVLCRVKTNERAQLIKITRQYVDFSEFQILHWRYRMRPTHFKCAKDKERESIEKMREIVRLTAKRRNTNTTNEFNEKSNRSDDKPK